MGMDLVGASLTVSEVREISGNIEKIANNIDDTMKTVSSLMTTLSGQSEGGLIQKTDESVVQLGSLVTTLVTSIIGIGVGIGEYLKTVIYNDQQAADTLEKSRRSNIYSK